VLEAASAASWPWFGPISNNGATLCLCILRTSFTYLPSVVRDFGFTLSEVNWLGNIIACVYLPVAFLTPIITKRYGLKRCVCTVSSHASHLLISLVQCDLATLLLLLSAWVRYAGTSRSLSKGGAYTLIIIGQVGEEYLKSFARLSSHTFVRHFQPFRNQYSRF
jgi:FLVCR family MFS transporter 7